MSWFSYFSVLAAVVCQVAGIQVDVQNRVSIKRAAGTLAQGLYAYHDPASTVGQFEQPEPWFWWLSGAGWTALIDYTAYTNDTTYLSDIHAALSENAGADDDFAPASQAGWEANDDQAYWVYTALSALEYGLPPLDCQAATSSPSSACANSWLALSVNVFEEFAVRWQNNSYTCNGGLKWQYNPEATGNGWTYKNSVTNGGFFQLAARLARYTGNSTYADWANDIWQWSAGVGLIGENYNVFDGTSDEDGKNCSDVNGAQYSYNIASYLHGAAHMFAYSDAEADNQGSRMWEGRTHRLLGAANQTFFSPFANATGIMYEQICEPMQMCNTDQASFKGSLARWMSKAAVLVPSAKDGVTALLTASAQGAAQSCSGLDNSTCGTKWYVGGYDGVTGFGQQLSGLEAMLSLMIDDAPELALASNGTQLAPPRVRSRRSARLRW